MWAIAAVIITIIILFLLYGYLSNLRLITTEYDIDTDGRAGAYTFAVIADLHCCKFGRDYKRLIELIDSNAPDAILIPGDMTIKHTTTNDNKVKRVIELIRVLSEKYPVFYANGNHEIRMYDEETYEAAIKNSGVKYLKNESEVFGNNNEINIFGLDLELEYYKKRIDLTLEQLNNYLGEAGTDNNYKILLAHDPTHIKSYAKWGADLIISGHLHGGIMRLPVIGGVIAPGFRLFPKYDSGMHDIDESKLIVSRGLGTHHLKFRFFNPPELVIIHMK